MALIEIKKITKTYIPDQIPIHALNKVDLKIKKGSFMAIMGPSGSGKSTLMHILGLLDPPTEGEYIFDGKNINALDKNELALFRNRTMGFVFQSFNLLSRATVRENVELPLLYSEIPKSEWKKRAEAAIESVGLTKRINNTSNQLSGGEKQRVAIARALVTDPLIIFADEPTGNLDSKTGEAIMDILAKLHKKDGKTILLVTHEKDTASYSENIINMKDGQIVSIKATPKRKRAYRK